MNRQDGVNAPVVMMVMLESFAQVNNSTLELEREPPHGRLWREKPDEHPEASHPDKSPWWNRWTGEPRSIQEPDRQWWSQESWSPRPIQGDKENDLEVKVEPW